MCDANGLTPSGGCCPVLLGTTAVGKTELVISSAASFPLEVISLDSRQVYHGLRIGTAQPSEEERAACAHHLVDFLSPSEKYSAARFRRDFCTVFQEIRSRGCLPVLVGGAGLYLQALQAGLFELEATQQAAVEQIKEELDKVVDAEIRRRLAELDEPSFRRIHANDRYRNQRALELCLATGRSLTELQQGQIPHPALGLRFPVVLLTRPADELQRRITIRTAAMLKAGWCDETAALLARYGAGAPGLTTIGYREIVMFLHGKLAEAELPERIITVTRQYAKRQRTWFRQVATVVEGPPESEKVRKKLALLLRQSDRE